jgi:tripartite-type tricarboxylate transporter receptor subunit TctC
MNLLSKALAVVAFALLTLGAQAQSYPNKPIRLVCPFPPGGAVDIASRAVAQALTQQLGQPVTVDNRPGAGGNIGAEIAAKSPADGYTLLMATSNILAINPVLYSKIPFDSLKDFAPVSIVVVVSNVLVLHPSVRANSVQEVIALAKAQPGKLTYASSGNGTSMHLAGELFKSMAGVDMVHIPYKGAAASMVDLLAGRVNMVFDSLPAALPNIKAGKLRALAVTGAKRSQFLPELPTIAEAALPGYETGIWFGIVAPAGTPPEIISRLNAELVKAAASTEFRERLTRHGFEVVSSTPEEMADSVRSEMAKWGKVVKALGMRVD